MVDVQRALALHGVGNFLHVSRSPDTQTQKPYTEARRSPTLTAPKPFTAPVGVSPARVGILLQKLRLYSYANTRHWWMRMTGSARILSS